MRGNKERESNSVLFVTRGELPSRKDKGKGKNVFKTIYIALQ